METPTTSSLAYPLRFNPVYKKAVWGGSAIADCYGRRDPPEKCGESWEISAHRDGDVALANGALAGATLSELAKRFGRDLVGAAAPKTHIFPLLCKIIDARHNLSVQVHPSPKAALAGAEEKNECWYILRAEHGAQLYMGTGEATPAELRHALTAGEANLIVSRPARSGDCHYVPSGLVHAIGAGLMIYEVQQSANTTYRLYDWGRTDAGIPRKLHLEQGFDAIDWNLRPPDSVQTEAVPDEWRECCATPYFKVRRRRCTRQYLWRRDPRTPRIIFVTNGACELTMDGHTEQLEIGSSCLLPACGGDALLHPLTTASEILATTLV